MSEKTVTIKIHCPGRHGLPGFWSAQRLWPEGESEHEVPESVALAMLGEIERGESILKVELVGPKAEKRKS